MRIKFNETGRSMIEILGVLAIIGILSIGGMAGYQYAYSSYQAGQIQDVVGKAKLLATQNNRSSHVKEVRRFVENMLSRYKPADTTPMVTHRDGKYIVDLFNVSDSICDKLQNRRDILNSMRIGMTPEACTTAEMNMQFTFDSVIIGGSVSGGTGDRYDDPNNPDIERCPDKQVWRQKEDGTYGCVCRHEYEFGDNCERCYPPKEWVDTENACRCPDYKPHWYNEDCVECVENTHCPLLIPVCNESYFCESCPSEKPYYNETTKVCEACSTNYPVYDVDNNQCITCYAANSEKPYWDGTMCTTCSAGTGWSITQNKCLPQYVVTIRNVNTVSTQIVLQGDKINSPATGYNGLVFSHWAVTPNGGAVSFPYTVTEDTVLYAYYNVSGSVLTNEYSIYGGNKNVTTEYQPATTDIIYKFTLYRGTGCAGGWRGCGYGNVKYSLDGGTYTSITCYQNYVLYGKRISIYRDITGIKNGDGCTTGTLSYEPYSVDYPY